MMISVKYNKAGGNVIIKITINAPMMHWSYKFEQSDSANDTTFKGTSEDEGMDNIRKHSLGFPNDLKGETDTWDIRLANISDKEQKFDLKIEWIQDEVVLKNIWVIDGKIAAGKPEIVIDSAILI